MKINQTNYLILTCLIFDVTALQLALMRGLYIPTFFNKGRFVSTQPQALFMNWAPNMV